MRRATTPSGATIWEPAPLTLSALRGSLVHLAGVHVLGPTLESLSRLTQDREMELWDGTRLTTEADVPLSNELADGHVCRMAPNVRIIATAPQIGDWLSEGVANMFATLAAPPMTADEERAVVQQQSGVSDTALDPVWAFRRECRPPQAPPLRHASAHPHRSTSRALA